ncbi:hypothetical protein V1478_002389 [Vespula squamosa]|uniref:Uncharacterized protein n=1 Tax=Vespula squamosa TaxID=30214 RepID=A0ABD2BVR6_VESSQ
MSIVNKKNSTLTDLFSLIVEVTITLKAITWSKRLLGFLDLTYFITDLHYVLTLRYGEHAHVYDTNEICGVHVINTCNKGGTCNIRMYGDKGHKRGFVFIIILAFGLRMANGLHSKPPSLTIQIKINKKLTSN